MIGENIQRIRRSRNLTLSQCAERAKISKSYLSNIERNLNKNPSIYIIKKVANVLDVNLNTLLGENTLNHLPEQEWIEFVKALQKSGIKKEQLKEYQVVIEFVKWQNGRKSHSEEEDK